MRLKRIKNNPFGTVLLLLFFWMCFFTLCRTVFLLYQQPLLKESSWGEMLLSYWYGWKMDLSMTAYLLAIPYLFLAVQQLLKLKWAVPFLRYYTLTLLVIIAIIVSAELELFVEWGVKLNRKAIFYLEHPTEVMGVTSNQVFLIVILSITLLVALSNWLYKKLFTGLPVKYEGPWWQKLAFILLVPVLLVVMLRGGLQQIPINQSVAYYSSDNVLNNAAVNSAWNTVFSLVKGRKYSNGNPYRYYDQATASAVVDRIYDFPRDSNTVVLKDNRPNIVLLILEGWSSDLIRPLGGYENVTPNFNALCREGLLFTNIYAAGLRSHEGMAAIFSGYPAQPVAALTSQPEKYPAIPVINQQLEQAGYTTFYGFGGELNYGNIKSYLVYAGFDKLIQGEDFSSDLPRAKLGVHDEYAFPRLLQEIGSMRKPFFASWFTVSSHAPYDIPEAYTIDINGLEVGYINSVFYTDKHLGRFFETARKQPWYKETLFIVMSDHGHSSPQQRNFFAPEYRKIPLLFYGEALKNEFKGKRIEKIGSQTDFAATLLSALQLDHSPYRWSKNLLNPAAPPFAYYSFDDGMGWIEPDNHFSYHHELNNYMTESFENEEKKQEVIRKGKSYLQTAFQDYLDL